MREESQNMHLQGRSLTGHIPTLSVYPAQASERERGGCRVERPVEPSARRRPQLPHHR